MSLQELINQADPGSILEIPAGTYHEQIKINKPLTLQGTDIVIIDGEGLEEKPMVHILSNDVILQNLIIQNGPLFGIQIADSATPELTGIVITQNTIRKNTNTGIISTQQAAMTISDNLISQNGQGSGFNRGGIGLFSHGPTTIINNIIDQNALEGIFARDSSAGLRIENNKITNHIISGITLAWDQRNTQIINNQISTCGSGLNDEQGGIVLIQALAEIIKNNLLENCNFSGLFWGWVPSQGPIPTEILIENNLIKNCSRDGIYLFSQGPGGFISPDLFPLEPLITNNTINNNARAGVFVSNLYYYSPGNAKPTLLENKIVDNGWGAINNTSQIVEAPYNWWGSNSGPYHPELNPAGIGNPVSNNIDFIPWLTKTPVIEKCKISAITLEDYQTAPPTNNVYPLDLTFKITGEIKLKINQEEKISTFAHWFTSRVNLASPLGDTLEPTIEYQGHCYGTLQNQSIQLEIEIGLWLLLQTRQSILIPTFGPAHQNTKCAPPKPISLNCIAANLIQDSYWIEKSLLHYLDLKP
jgi:parallel beta-helix repeat protein